MGAFLNAFSARNSGKYSPKDLAKEREEYRRNHPSDEEEDYYVYYGDPQQQLQQEEVTMTQNALNPEFSGLNGHRSPSNHGNGMPPVVGSASAMSPTVTAHREVEVFFEDETCVMVTAEVGIRAIELISRALEKRGVNTTMAHLFVLCVKEGSQSADSERVVTLEGTANPIASMPTYNLMDPKLVVCYKQGAQ